MNLGSKKVWAIVLLVVCSLRLSSQDSVRHRLIFVGDAGAVNGSQQAIISDAAAHNLPGKTTAIFLGDNIYPRGMEVNATEQEVSSGILHSQFDGLRAAGITVYFLPGNHDWDKSGRDGFNKVIALNAFVNALQDSMVKVIPADACPGPYELTVTDNLVVIAMDTEWWLHPHATTAEPNPCACKNKAGLLAMLDTVLQRHRNKLVIFATHHPFVSYGPHGGYFSLKDHLFPLTNVSAGLYIPLPVIGSLYPIYRKVFPPKQDTRNRAYKKLINDINARLGTHPNLIHVSGHEHALQLIRSEQLQVVSGSGSKTTPVKMGKGSLYATAKQGYVIADLLNKDRLRLSFFVYDKKLVVQDFKYEFNITKVN